MNSRWMSNNPKEFVAGDIICDSKTQDFLKLVVYKNDVALWCTGLVHCALTENNDKHPIFAIYFDEIQGSELLRLGNLKDFQNFVDNAENEVMDNIKKIEKNYRKL